ncbi:LOW QUALITY PROTEIN: transmembrane efflux protein, partial [Streptomyces sviceus ATCC 29083]
DRPRLRSHPRRRLPGPSPALADTRRHLSRAADRAARQHDPERGHPLPDQRTGRRHLRHPVDDQRVLAGAVGPPAHRGQRGRPLRPQEDAGRGTGAVRRRVAGRGSRRLHRPADRGTGRDGRGRCAADDHHTRGAMQIFAPGEQPKAIGIWAAVNSLGFAAGPLLGGFMLNHFWWGAIFLINLPVAALALVAVVLLVPESKNPRGDRPDLLGALLSTIGMASLVFAIISGPEHGWTSGRVLTPAAVAVVVLAGFAYWESRIPHPMLDMHFFRDRRFTGAVAGAVLITFGMGGSLFLLTQHMQFVLGYGPLEAGLRTAPLALMIVALNFTGLAAKWSARLGTPLSIGLGMAVMAAGLLSIATLTDHGYPGTLLGLVLIGAGAAVASPAMAHAIMSAIPPEKAGVGAGINGTVAEFGQGLGVAVLGAVLNARFAAGISVAAVSLPGALAQVGSVSERARITEAFASGLESSQLVGAVAVLLGGVVAGVLLRRAEQAQDA